MLDNFGWLSLLNRTKKKINENGNYSYLPGLHDGVGLIVWAFFKSANDFIKFKKIAWQSKMAAITNYNSSCPPELSGGVSLIVLDSISGAHDF